MMMMMMMVTFDLMPAMEPKQELNALVSFSPMFVPAVHSRAAEAPRVDNYCFKVEN